MKKLLLSTLLAALFIGMHAQEEEQPGIPDTIKLTTTQVNNLYKEKKKNYVSVHDPSVVYDSISKYYYIYGSHIGAGRTKDLQNWSGVSNNIFGKMVNGKPTTVSADQAFRTHTTTKVKALRNGEITEVDFGNFDATDWHCSLPGNEGQAWSVWGNMWAPDIIYNKVMKKWCFYLSLNGPQWNSVIVLMTSSSIQGPFVYEGPVVFSGFKSATDTRIDWKKTDLQVALGELSSLPTRYRQNNWGNYWPHAIDPCVFYDEKGQLWMSYGSWSGGIYILKLDNETGLRDYTVSYPSKNDASGRPNSDPYFGKQIAGGYYVSGEGSYIQFINNYYYLFVTNGGLSAKEGYVMRVFRSKNPDGPYTDGKGYTAIYPNYQMNYSTRDAESRGNLIVTSHNGLGFQTVGEVAQGHNSAIVDDKGRAFVVYHTRFNNGGEGHLVKVRQLFTARDGWLVAAPFEYDGETINQDSIAQGCKFTDKQIAGEYEVMRLRYKLDNANLECVRPEKIKFNEDGTITGDLAGTWKVVTGTGYITIKLAGLSYNGVVLEQMFDGTTIKSVSITASSKTGVAIWCVKMQPQYAIAYNVKNFTPPIKAYSTIKDNVDLTTPTTFGVKCEWTSSDPDVLSDSGELHPRDTVATVIMTCRFSCDNYYYERDYKVKTKAEVTGIEEITSSGLLPDGIYNLAGQRVPMESTGSLPKGIYIISSQGKTRKMLIK